MAQLPVVANITSFLQGLTGKHRDELYDSPWTCQAVLRSLPPLAKAYVLRLLLIDFPVPKEVVDSWPADPQVHGARHRVALDTLLALNIFVRGVGSAYLLNPTFQARLQWAISTGGCLLQVVPPEVLAAAPSAQQLDGWAHSQWEALQMYLLDASTEGPYLPDGVPLKPLNFFPLLVGAGLLAGSRPADRAITDTGFQFLLRDSHRQLWVFLTRYIKEAAASSSGDLTAVMSFLMQLGFMRVGQPYALKDLSTMEQSIAGHMMQLGLLLPFEAQRQVYYCPTRLASSLCTGGAGVGVTGRDTANADIAGGHIIVESNFKVNAWTTSRVQRALLCQFCRCEASLPNFWVGSLTPESVGEALNSGISSNEIIAYLQSHAHPHIAQRVPVVPENVGDQLGLWEAETKRVQAYPARFYDNFENRDLFVSILRFAHAKGWLLWEGDACFAAEESGYEAIKDAIRAVKAAQAANQPLPTLV